MLAPPYFRCLSALLLAAFLTAGSPGQESGKLPNTSPSMAMKVTLLYSSDALILDAARLSLHDSPMPALLVLQPGLLLYAIAGSNSSNDASSSLWEPNQQVALPASAVPLRDLRGRLAQRAWPHFDVYLPGETCNGSLEPQLTVKCEPNTDPWPTGAALLPEDALDARFPPTRNFFSGEVSSRASDANLPPFFTAAHISTTRPDNASAAQSAWLLAGLDGRVRSYDGQATSLTTITGWGSEIAGVRSPCGSHSQVLVTRDSEWSVADSVQAWESSTVLSPNPSPTTPAPSAPVRSPSMSAPVMLPGPVTALWTAAAGQSAVAVVHNLTTGGYEAYELAVTCDQ